MARLFTRILWSSAILLLSLEAGLTADEDSWRPLREVRDRLAEASPLAADFVQTYTPAGFTDGEQETGRLLLALPGCLRWDYAEPYPRSYLLCEQTVWAWSPDEAVGDRFLDVSRDEAGLDFLLLSIERLAERYEATSSASTDDRKSLELAPRDATTAFERASIVVDQTTGRPVEIAYRDREGNETRFVLSGFRPLADPTLLTPPATVEWIDG